MKPIRWRKDRATVEGVILRRNVCDDGRTWLGTMLPPLVSIHILQPGPDHVSAAAYALADLVQTLRGLE